MRTCTRPNGHKFRQDANGRRISLVRKLIVPIWKSRPSRGLAICMQIYRRAICMQTHRRAIRIHDWACIGGVKDRPHQNQAQSIKAPKKSQGVQ